MNMQKYSPDMTHYPLTDQLVLTKAEQDQFIVSYTIYKNANPFYRQDWKINLQALDTADPNKFFWVTQNGQRIAGVILAPNEISGLFLIPPFSDQFMVLSHLKRILFHWSDPKKKIFAFGILTYQLEDFIRLGFWQVESNRAMLCPTGPYTVEWPSKYEIRSLQPTDQTEIIALINHAHQGGIVDHNRGALGLKPEDRSTTTKYFFDHFLDQELLRKASLVVIDPMTGKIVAGCLVSIWLEWPLIYEVFVDPAYQGNGLAARLIQHALDTVKDDYPVMRLFVTCGNPAESLYYNLGFLPMPMTSLLYIPERQEN